MSDFYSEIKAIIVLALERANMCFEDYATIYNNVTQTCFDCDFCIKECNANVFGGKYSEQEITELPSRIIEMLDNSLKPSFGVPSCEIQYLLKSRYFAISSTISTLNENLERRGKSKLIRDKIEDYIDYKQYALPENRIASEEVKERMILIRGKMKNVREKNGKSTKLLLIRNIFKTNVNELINIMESIKDTRDARIIYLFIQLITEELRSILVNEEKKATS